MDGISLLKTLMFIFVPKIKFIPHLVHLILLKHSRLVILGTLSISVHKPIVTLMLILIILRYNLRIRIFATYRVSGEKSIAIWFFISDEFQEKLETKFFLKCKKKKKKIFDPICKFLGTTKFSLKFSPSKFYFNPD